MTGKNTCFKFKKKDQVKQWYRKTNEKGPGKKNSKRNDVKKSEKSEKKGNQEPSAVLFFTQDQEVSKNIKGKRRRDWKIQHEKS